MQDFKDNLESLRINGDITTEGYNAANTALNKAIDISKTVPATITNVDERKTAIDLIQKRDELTAQLEGVDPDLAAPIQEELKNVKGQLQDLAKGVKPKVEETAQPTTAAAQATQETVNENVIADKEKLRLQEETGIANRAFDDAIELELNIPTKGDISYEEASKLKIFKDNETKIKEALKDYGYEINQIESISFYPAYRSGRGFVQMNFNTGNNTQFSTQIDLDLNENLTNLGKETERASEEFYNYNPTNKSTTQATQPTQPTENAIQEQPTTQEIPRTGEAGQNIPEGGQGVRPSEQGQETAQQGKEEITTKTKTDEKTEKGLMLEGLQATGDEGKGGQAGAKLRTESQAQEKEIEELAEPIVIFKGNTGKLNPDGSRRTAHPNIQGVFGSTDLKSAERYGNDISKFDIPKGTTVETVEIKNKKIPLSEARKQETELVNASDAQIVRLITYDAKGREVQYIIKDKSILQQNKPIKNVEELSTSKAESKKEVAQAKDIVVDEDGKPLVVYHGTGTDFESFDSEKSTDATRFGKGVSFTTGKGIAMRYSLERQGLQDNMENDEKAIIKSANLIMKKPFDERRAVDNTTPEAIKLKEILVNKYGLNPKYVDNVLSGNTPSSKSAFQLISEAIFDPATDKKTFMFVGNTEKTRKLLEEVGYDSIIDRYEDSFEYFVFDTKNIIPITKENLTPNITTNETKNENGKENVSKNEDGEKRNAENENEEVTQPRLSDFGLTYKNVNDKFNEVSKVMPYRALETALEDLGVERSDLDSAKEAFLAEFISKELPSKLPNKKDKFDKDDLPKGEVVVKPIIKKITPSNPSNTKTKTDSLKNIVGNDDLRPVMNGVFQDAENGMLVATDAIKLIAVSDATITESKIVDPKTGQIYQGRFPNYLAIIPQNNPIQVDVNVQDLINQTAGISRASDFFVGKNQFAIALRLKIGDNSFYFNPKSLNDVLTVFANYGAKDVTFKLSTPARAMLIEYGGVTGLVMPVIGENNQGNVLPHVTIVNRELTNKEKADGIKADLEYLSKKLEDKKKKLSDAKNNVRDASSNKDLNSANFDVKYEEKAVAEAQLEYDNKKAELDNLDNPLQEQFDLETVKTAIENGEITEQEATEFIESTIENTTEVESVIENIESKAESNNEVELNEVIQNADKLISSKEGAQVETNPFTDLANQLGEAAKEAVKPETPTAQTFADISQNGKAGRDARESARKKFGKDAVAKMEEISRNFDKLIQQLETENKVRKECP